MALDASPLTPTPYGVHVAPTHLANEHMRDGSTRSQPGEPSWAGRGRSPVRVNGATPHTAVAVMLPPPETGTGPCPIEHRFTSVGSGYSEPEALPLRLW
jgi:hypothetical protein